MESIHLVYQGRLPNVNKEAPPWWKRHGLKRRCMRQFGVMPYPAKHFAVVHVRRILGPRERLRDPGENFPYSAKGLVDALTNQYLRRYKGGYKVVGGGNYIVDDSAAWASITYEQDATRRHEGPKTEVLITYCSGKEQR